LNGDDDALYCDKGPIVSNPYTITGARLDWGKMPVALRFSYGTVSMFDFLIVRLWCGDAEGTGEVLVPPNEHLKQLVQGLIDADSRGLDTLLPEPGNDTDRILGEAVSIALHDLVARRSGLPLHVLLGGTGHRRVPLMPCLFPIDAGAARREAKKWWDQGYQRLKVKLVGDFKEDQGRVEGIRAVTGRNLVLQGDANEGYKEFATALRAVNGLGKAGLDIFEDPLAGDVAAYAELTRRRDESGARVMVDVLARNTTDLAAVLRRTAADVVGIHPDQPGSLSRAMLHARMATAMGVPVVIGGTGYTAVGSAAYQHLAAVVTPGGPCGELGGYFDHGMPRHLLQESLPMVDGEVMLPDVPGLGVRIDEEALMEFRIDSLVL